jgi:carbonic anhydrase
MPRPIIEGLRRFRRDFFPRFRDHYERLVKDGQKPSTLFLGCADSRVVPDLLTDSMPGDLFVVRNVGALVPPFEPDAGYHGTSASIEFATLVLEVKDIVLCGHSHCGAIRALYDAPRLDTPHIVKWLELARPAALEEPVSPDMLRRTEMRAIVLQIEHLLTFPMVRERMDRGDLFVHGWHYVIEEGKVMALDLDTGEFSAVEVEPGAHE